MPIKESAPLRGGANSGKEFNLCFNCNAFPKKCKSHLSEHCYLCRQPSTALLCYGGDCHGN